MKRNFVIFSLITSILSFIIIILVYFGLVRYLKTYTHSIEYHTKEYVKGTNEPEKIIISIDPSVKNIKKLKPCINSLLDQTVKVSEIAINTLTTSKYEIPDSYKKVLSIYHTDTDGMIESLKREHENDTIIIHVSDKYIYPKDFVENILELSRQNPDKIIKHEHKYTVVKPMFYTSFNKPSIMDIITDPDIPNIYKRL
jgi:hypothetical protein